MLSLGEHFSDYFQILLAWTPALLAQAYRIRFDVYCREFHYELEENFPDGLEQDEYDQHSLHCLIVHKASHLPAGCVRLVKTPAHDSSFLLPFTKFCGNSLTHVELHPNRLPHTSVAEVSRLAVHPTFRRRWKESESPFGRLSPTDIPEREARTFPLLTFALFTAGAALMTLAHRRHAFIMVEPRLARRLQNSGLLFTQIGKLIDYHGPREAYHITIEQALNGMKNELRDLYDLVYANLKKDAALSGLDPVTQSTFHGNISTSQT